MGVKIVTDYIESIQVFNDAIDGKNVVCIQVDDHDTCFANIDNENDLILLIKLLSEASNKAFETNIKINN